METIIREFPPLSDDQRPILAPVKAVTVLEDRAQVTRRARLSLEPGAHRLVVQDVAPLLRDVSLRAEAEGVQIPDARVVRCRRARYVDLPENARLFEEAIDAKEAEIQALADEVERAQARASRVDEILRRAAEELPRDVSFGLFDPEGWRASFGDLFERARALGESALGAAFAIEDHQRELATLRMKRNLLDQPTRALAARLELTVLVERPTEFELSLSYEVPNALWRPLHRALLTPQGLEVESRAAVWQHTGEDWTDAELSFSTARAAGGTEPPLLADDLLTATKRAEQVKVAVRDVRVEKAGVVGGAAPSGAVELPGVDDGGEVRNLKAETRVSVPSDGRPLFVSLFRFSCPAEISHVCYPELNPAVLIRAVGTNRAPYPLLAGPVELLLDTGLVGRGELLFVAPGAAFEQSFGPLETVQVVRQTRQETEVDPDDKWRHQTYTVWLSVSQLGDQPVSLTLTERIPVSEIPQVKVKLDEKFSERGAKADADGRVALPVSLEPHSQKRLKLRFVVSVAPGVEGL